jgi:hypothetical protein
MIVFMLSGFWHGANWTYIIWGALNGVYLVVGIATQDFRANASKRLGLARFPRLQSIASVGVTFMLICLAWVFFRARNLTDAWTILSHMGLGFREALAALPSSGVAVGSEQLAAASRSIFLTLGAGKVLVCVFLILALLCVEYFQAGGSLRVRLMAQPLWLRWAVYYALVYCTIFLGAYDSGSQFIYFQF